MTEPNWIQTRSGRRFNLNYPDPESIDIHDIAHALSHICRFTGHCSDHYSVAQHSVHVSDIVPRRVALVALLHDAAEAYVGDVSTPLKDLLPTYRAIEQRVWLAVQAKFDLPIIPPVVLRADATMLATEVRDLMSGSGWEPEERPLRMTIDPWSPELSAVIFMTRFFELTGGQDDNRRR